MKKYFNYWENESDKNFLSCILADATYDSPWFGVKVSDKTPKEVAKTAWDNNDCREDIWADVLLNGGTLVVTDYEDDEKTYEFTIKSVTKGMKKMQKQHPRMYANIVEEYYDFYDVDALLQTIVFGEVVYG